MHRDLVVVPVDHRGPGRAVVLRTGRRPGGRRVGYAFSSPDDLIRTLGSGQPWFRLTHAALTSLLAPLGIREVVVDPTSVADPPPPTETASRATVRPRQD
ncbi:SAV_915 family protein [Streptomyces sp. GbtcB6]|uniref:SAV_915 family protein n=1 Tax=Streptomyces sp. GbtcB6 TaxID=2824751 RepID=UPI001C307A61|nr:SAV_915 family protein [Streptomyces sp. GbtcB6]